MSTSAHCLRIGRANLPVCLPGPRMNLMGVIRNGRGEEKRSGRSAPAGQDADAPKTNETSESRALLLNP